MKLFWQITKIFLTVLLLSQLAAKNSYAVPKKNLTIFAEPNIMVAMTKLARIYSKRSNVIVSVNFNSSEELLNQIDQGEPADLLITANSNSIEEVKQKGLADYYNIGFFAKDEIVLVRSKKIGENLTREDEVDLDTYLRELDGLSSTIITDALGSSSGNRAVSYLNNLSLENIKLFSKIAEDESSVLKLVRNNKKHYGLLFLSQVYDDPDLTILARSNRGDIFYQALVVLGYNMETAREFLRFLKSKTAQDILKQNKLTVS
jgi:molybdate transport system substrate-binding protein